MSKKKMNKHVPKTTQVKKVKSDLKTLYYLILLGYILIPVLTPNFNTLDSRGTKFLSIAILNLVSFAILLKDPDYTKHHEIRSDFFRSFVGIAYTLFLGISLLSFFNAINLSESVLAFVKTVTVFAAAYILFVIFRSNRKYLLHAALMINFLLLADCLTVFYHMLNLIEGKVSTVYEIKSVYSHKNILASALFVKLPASIWLMFFSGRWKKILGYVVGLSAILATFLLSTRAFYLGLGLLLISLILFAIVRFFVAEKRSQLIAIARWAGLFLLALVVFITAQRFLFPQKDSILGNMGIASRLSSIRADESSTSARLDSWKRTLRLIGEHPVLGVGTGNWKVQVLKYENPTLEDHIFMYKNHNDFLEVTAETGIPGGIAYLLIFILVLYGFIKTSLKPGHEEDRLKFLFFSAFGILAYSVDAFFNFPADRPEIQVLFAIYVASAAAYAAAKPVRYVRKAEEWPAFLQNLKRLLSGKLIAAIALLTMIIAIWVLFMLVRSLHYQLLAKQDLDRDKFIYTSSVFLEGFPAIPNLNAYSGPIAITKARYLIREKRERDAISLLLSDHSSPYESEREYFLALAYFNLGMDDSALVYSYQVLKMKPLFYKIVSKICNVIEARGDLQTPVKLLQNYLKLKKTNSQAWIYITDLYQETGDMKKSLETIYSAYKYLPKDSLVIKKRNFLQYQVWMKSYQGVMEEANIFFTKKDFRKAIIGYSKIIKQEPDYMQPYELRGLSYFYLKEYKKAIDDYSCLIKHKINAPRYFNARGECYHFLKNDDAACRDFKVAMNKGNTQAGSNFRKFYGKTFKKQQGL